MKTQIENPALLNSRFRFDEVLFLDVNFYWLNLTRGSSYLPPQDWIARKKAVVNPQNDDEECFKWAVIAAENFKEIGKNPQRVSNLRKFTDNYDWSGLKFPVSIKDIEKFKNKNNVSVNVLVVEEKDIYICRKSNHRRDREINLMLISEDDRWHYTVIKSLSRLVTSRNTKHHGKQYFCTNCLQGFMLESSRDEHYGYCIDNETVRTEKPKKGSTVEFYDGQNQFKVPLMMYEAILYPIQGPSPDPSEPDAEGVGKDYIKEVNQHIPSGFCVYSKFAYGGVENPLRLYRGEDCVEKFCDHIKEEAKRLYHMFPEKPMDSLTNGQLKEYKKASECHICYKPFGDKDPKVRDHRHYTGQYRGPAHRTCNLRYKIPSYIPVVFHNLSGYDAHLFIRELGKKTDNIGVIAKNKEDYITFSVDVAVDKYHDKEGNEKDKTIQLRFIDSFKFMASSLDSLMNNLVKAMQAPRAEEVKRWLVLKIILRSNMSYSYMSSWDKFAETELPQRKNSIAI